MSTTWRERLEPRTLPTRDYIASNLFVGAILQLISEAVVASLAISRAQGHRLSGWSVLVILVGSAIFNAITGAVVAYVGGAYDVTAGRVLADERGEPAAARPSEKTFDPLAPRAIWLRALVWSLGAGVWGVAVSLLVVAALDGRAAGYPIVFIGLLAVSAVVAIASNALWRATGVGVARSGAIGEMVSLRKRAWIEVGLPMACVLGAVTAFFSWVLFHDYAVGDAFASRVLTEREIFADLLVLLLILGGIGVYVAGQFARADVRLRYVRPDDSSTQILGPKVSFGPQAIVYAGFATFVVAAVVRLAIPAYPTLAQAMVVRGAMGMLIGWVITGLAYVRAAGNELSATRR